MNPAVALAASMLALVAAGAMGWALQRGGTCMVAAMEELVQHGRGDRLRALLEAALWVGAGLLLARTLGVLPGLPPQPAFTAWTLGGAVVLGVGALVNGACVFGAVARLGAGDWAYLAMPPGFFLGCVATPRLRALSTPVEWASGAQPLMQVPDAVVGLVVVVLLCRVGWALRRRWRQGPWHAPLSQHAATAAIGVAFLALMLLAGAWAYTDVLADLARGASSAMAEGLRSRVALGVALFVGALYGGWRSGRWRPQAPRPTALLRCFVGGALLGVGSQLVPGGNDSVLLVGMPLLWGQAWAAAAVMCIVIAAVLRWRLRLRRRAGAV